MAKGIDIKLSSKADLVGFRETSEALAKMAKVSKEANEAMSSADRRQAAEWMSVRSAADKAARGATLSAKQIEENWRKYLESTKENAKKNFKETAAAAQESAEKSKGAFRSFLSEVNTGLRWAIGGKIVDKMLGGVTGLVRKSVSGVRAAIAEAFKFETAIAGFKTLTGSIDEAKRHVDDLRRFSASNPLTFDDVSNASKTLQSFGISVNEVMPTLKTLGDISLGQSEKFKSLALVFGQIRSVGRLMGQDLLQLVNQGFNPLTIIAEETGRSVSELRKTMEAGGISFEMVAAAMRKATAEGGLFHDALKNAAETGDGMVAKMKDSWDGAVRTVGDAFAAAAKDGIGKVTKEIDRLNEDGTLEEWAERSAESVSAVGRALAGVGSVLGKVWTGVKGTLGTAMAFAAGADQAFGEGRSFREQLAAGRDVAAAYWANEMGGGAEEERKAERAERRKRERAKETAKETAAAEEAEKKTIREMFEESERKIAEEKARKDAEKAEQARAKAEVKAAQDAARERERLDRELHQKRMADLRAEIAEQTKGANGLRAAAAGAQSEFDRAFAMYRDPSRAAAEIAEEKDYREDLDRLHRDARRYGGKWRIDELSRLMAAGDSQGASDTLAEWRKSSRFTPEVEAMVRASAAEMTKTTAEDELRKIESNTAGLAEKLDELLSMKGGS